MLSRFGAFLPCGRPVGSVRMLSFKTTEEAVVCPAISATHGLGHLCILPVPLPDDDVVDEMPVLRVRVHPIRPVTGREAGDCVGDQQFMLCAGLEQ